MTICTNCWREIPDQTDDNYNADHTKIQCPNCDNWQKTILQWADTEGSTCVIKHPYTIK